jgi:hypothetical protein
MTSPRTLLDALMEKLRGCNVLADGQEPPIAICKRSLVVNSTSPPPRFFRMLFTILTTPLAIATAILTTAAASHSPLLLAARSHSNRAMSL